MNAYVKDAEWARALLMGLIRECPFGGNPLDCQGHDLRRDLSMEARVDWVQNLSTEECERLYASHLACLRGKEKVAACHF